MEILLWKSYENLWKSYEYLWKIMENLWENLWKPMENLWKFDENTPKTLYTIATVLLLLGGGGVVKQHDGAPVFCLYLMYRQKADMWVDGAAFFVCSLLLLLLLLAPTPCKRAKPTCRFHRYLQCRIYRWRRRSRRLQIHDFCKCRNPRYLRCFL